LFGLGEILPVVGPLGEEEFDAYFIAEHLAHPQTDECGFSSSNPFP